MKKYLILKRLLLIVVHLAVVIRGQKIIYLNITAPDVIFNNIKERINNNGKKDIYLKITNDNLTSINGLLSNSDIVGSVQLKIYNSNKTQYFTFYHSLTSSVHYNCLISFAGIYKITLSSPDSWKIIPENGPLFCKVPALPNNASNFTDTLFIIEEEE